MVTKEQLTRALYSPPSAEITDREYEALKAVISHRVSENIFPSYTELSKALEVSRTRAKELVDGLVGKGYLDREPGKRRGLKLNLKSAEVYRDREGLDDENVSQGSLF